jgi:rare lipoprotein A
MYSRTCHVFAIICSALRSLLLGLSLVALSACSVGHVEPAAAAPATFQPQAPSLAATGTASWYGTRHQGRLTASGERFDARAFTAAHRSLPFGTILRVTNLANGETVKVRVNDRGPYVRGRTLDLSTAAAKALGITKDGVARVRIEVFAADQMPGSSAIALAAQ